MLRRSAASLRKLSALLRYPFGPVIVEFAGAVLLHQALKTFLDSRVGDESRCRDLAAVLAPPHDQRAPQRDSTHLSGVLHV